ncbi:MAG: hypothetical protein ACOYIE_00540 [Agathobaculum sp.]|jgi:phenylpyruvate tautomerase PptA (4-oxalocrotonate tautomerase family)|uniref:hypothetical protein n=1 Tax=Agathobaculum sp. TaxID=2048138 RepID=UPI003D90D664
MPYIGISTSKVLTEEQKSALAAALGEKISLIPNKIEANLMVDISDGHAMYLGSVKRELAYVDLRCYDSVEFSYKKAYTEAALEALHQVTGLAKDCMYLNYTEYPVWGSKGTLKGIDQ